MKSLQTMCQHKLKWQVQCFKPFAGKQLWRFEPESGSVPGGEFESRTVNAADTLAQLQYNLLISSPL